MNFFLPKSAGELFEYNLGKKNCPTLIVEILFASYGAQSFFFLATVYLSIIGRRHMERFLMAGVVVMAAPILLLVWHQLFTKPEHHPQGDVRSMGTATRAHHSLSMTTTQAIRDLFAWCSPIVHLLRMYNNGTLVYHCSAGNFGLNHWQLRFCVFGNKWEKGKNH